MNAKKTVLLGSIPDSGLPDERWQKVRPTLSLCQHADLWEESPVQGDS